LINMVAQSAAHYHDHGLLGMGFDFGTGAEVRAGGLLTGIFGSSSVAIVDFRTANARYHWGGRGKNLLSARRILTQILGPDPGLAYSVPTRRPEMDGGPVPFRPPENPPACAPAIQNSGKVVLLGGSFDENHDQQLRRFVAVLNVHHVRQVAILVFGKANARRSQAALRRTEADLRASGWNQAIQSWPIDEVGGALQPSEASIVSSGVLMLAGDGATMHSIILQPELRALIGEVMRRSPAVITDGAMTAVLGSAYAGNPWPAPTQVSEAAIQAFRSGAVSIDSGLGLFPTLDFVPRLYANEAWGQLYSLSRADHEVQVVGIGEASALVVQPFMASSANRCATITVTGKQPAVSLDARAATFRPATNGTFSALNVLMNVYAPGDTLTR
ncbi:MAG: hypothetical protein ACRD4G_14965, partial [Bryobacteraceae bacterium]